MQAIIQHTEIYEETGDLDILIITNHINGQDLQSVWAFTIRNFRVEGILIDDISGEVVGPFDDFQMARQQMGVDVFDTAVKFD